jgi:hypothetical protein
MVGTNHDPSDAIHLWISFSVLLPPQISPGILNSTPRQVNWGKKIESSGTELSAIRLTNTLQRLSLAAVDKESPKGPDVLNLEVPA